MKTIATQLYTFDELNEDAQEVAIDDYRNMPYEDFWQSEREDSFKQAKTLYDELHNIESEISGGRLYTWIENHFSHIWTNKIRFSKHKDGTFLKSDWQYKYDCVKFRTSRIFTINNLENCPLTGFCNDYDFLKPIIDFMKHPDKYTSNTDLTIPDYQTIWQRDYEAYTSKQFIIEELQNREEEDFTEEGKKFPSFLK